MGFRDNLAKQLTKFGGNNKPTVIVMGIAAAKGIFRPVFTMMDKKESYETKRYTALREGLTEVVAIPVYYLSGVASAKVAEQLAKPKNFISKDLYNKHKNGDKSKEVLSAVKRAENLAKENLPKLKVTNEFIGVCLSALFFIPMLCSVTIKPIMKHLEKSQKEKEAQVNSENPVVQRVQPLPQKPAFNGYSRVSYGMKVGGV